MASAEDTCHWTNCSPQHSKFNQISHIWNELEQRILQDSIAARLFGAQIFTGPVLDEGDPVRARFQDIQDPVRFWKVAVARTSADEVFAAAFILDQSEAIRKFGIKADIEVPFGAFRTFQVPVGELEEETGRSFLATVGGKKVPLSSAGPLADRCRMASSRRRRLQTETSFEASTSPPGYVLLEQGGTIIR